MIEIKGVDDYDKFVDFVDKHSQFIVKPNNLGLGMGIHIEDINTKDAREIFKGFQSEIEDIKSKSEEDESSIVLEEMIIQDEAFSKLYPKAVNIIRITTIIVDNAPVFLDAWLRIGMGGYSITAANLAEL